MPGSSTVEVVASHWKLYAEIASRMGRNLQAPLSWPTWLQDAGFTNVQSEDFEWPMGARKGEKDERMRKVGEISGQNYLTGLRGFNVGFFTRGAGWSEEKVDEYLVEVTKAIQENPGESVMPLKVVWGQSTLR